jgi:precorrin-2 dehydrogenase/sirohydrochlorin ferrochelatase
MLDIKHKKCAVIGGGSVANRKVKSLLQYEADIVIISEQLIAELANTVNKYKLDWQKKEYSSEDLFGNFMVFAATNNSEVNHQIYKEAKAKGILINVVDDPERCDFIVPSKLEQGDLTISISTNGKSPMLAKKIRQDLTETYTPAYGELLNILGDLRQKSMNHIPDENNRKKLYHDIVYSDIIHLLEKGNLETATKLVESLYNKYSTNE